MSLLCAKTTMTDITNTGLYFLLAATAVVFTIVGFFVWGILKLI